ncbi:MAG: hypothetical protein HY047_18790 [Acidobacteria bacterium]|nr:hypothetical protein [Acidobacteriota bacterium]
MPEDFPWYEAIRGSETLRQGDIFEQFPVLVPPKDLDLAPFLSDNSLPAPAVPIRSVDVIVITQSCDLENNKVDVVVLCAIAPFTEFADSPSARSQGNRKKVFDKLKGGAFPSCQLLDACELDGVKRPHRIVDFRTVFAVPLGHLTMRTRTTEPRLRLLPPYREHLAQGFARYYMRVGLPIEIKTPED